MCNENTRKREEEIEIFEAIMTEKFSKLISEIKQHIQEAQITLSRINVRKHTSRHMLFKIQKIKDKILKEVRGKMSYL